MGVIAAGDPQTAEAGAELFRDGGNAIDAAVGAAFAAFVCELPLCSPLGGGVCVLEHGSSAPVAFDMFARAPGRGWSGPRRHDFEAVTVSFGAATQVFHVGRASVAVPLALAGLLEIQQRFGRLPLPRVVAPAVALGRNGYVVGPGIAFAFDLLSPILERTTECRELVVDASGAIAKTGARLANANLAAILEAVAKRPETVRDIHAALAREIGPAEGGLITADDLAAAEVRQHAPVVVMHRDWQLATMPSPSSGGVLVALGLRMLEGVREAGFLSKEHVLLVARAQEALLRLRGDAAFTERLADPEAVRMLLGGTRNLLGSTTQISAIDDAGTTVSMTLTNGEGSGHVLAGTGMIANNLLGEEDIHPNGFHRDPAGTALSTMMAPTLLSRGHDRIALGSGGSNRLRTAILQVLVGLLEHEVSPTLAVTAPRLHLELDRISKKPRIAFEAPGLADDVAEALRDAYPDGPAVFAAPNLYFGGVHLARRLGNVYDGVGDARRGGASVVTPARPARTC